MKQITEELTKTVYNRGTKGYFVNDILCGDGEQARLFYRNSKQGGGLYFNKTSVEERCKVHSCLWSVGGVVV